jgi:hypothetical protein
MTIEYISTVVGVKMSTDDLYYYCICNDPEFELRIKNYCEEVGFDFQKYRDFLATFNRKDFKIQSDDPEADMFVMLNDTAYYLDEMTYPVKHVCDNNPIIYCYPHDTDGENYAVVGYQVMKQFISATGESVNSMDWIVTRISDAVREIQPCFLPEAGLIEIFTIPNSCQCCN